MNYAIQYSALSDLVSAVEERVKTGSNIVEAMKTAGNHLVTTWVRNANTAFKQSQGGYVQGIIQGIEYPYEGNDLHFAIIHQDPKAVFLENGTKPFDMKKALYTSDKVRISKDGKRYLIIPFEHGTPDAVTKNAMPKEIYKHAKNLNPSAITGHRMEGSQRTATSYEEAQALKYDPANPTQVQRLTYKWGGKLNTENSRYQGMYRFERNPENVRQEVTRETGVGKFTYVNVTDNNKAYGNYITFRVMTEDSDGWQHPGIPAMGILKKTVEEVEAPIKMMLAEAVKKDLDEMFPN